MKKRGRPARSGVAPRYANRLRELRERLALSQQAIARQAGISAAYYGALERGDKRINVDTAQRLHRPLRCAVSDLLAGTQGMSVPLLLAVAAGEVDNRPTAFDLPEPYEWLNPGRVADPAECAAAEIFDDSADLDFARGTLLFFRRLAQWREPLRVGAKVIVRFFLEPLRPEAARQTHEVLYGILDQNIVGDLVLITRTRNRLLPRHALIKAAAIPRGGLAEQTEALRPRDGAIDYQPHPDDPAEILGVVVYTMGPI